MSGGGDDQDHLRPERPQPEPPRHARARDLRLHDAGRSCREAASAHAIVFRQSNAEFALFNWIHEAIDRGAAIVINPAGLSFTSIPTLDALKMFAGPIVEVHISNIHRREAQYQKSLVSLAATGVICGLGAEGYRCAVSAAAGLIA